MGVAVGMWLLFGGSRYLRFECVGTYCIPTMCRSVTIHFFMQQTAVKKL